VPLSRATPKARDTFRHFSAMIVNNFAVCTGDHDSARHISPEISLFI
jgi:hypothetical protein